MGGATESLLEFSNGEFSLRCKAAVNDREKNGSSDSGQGRMVEVGRPNNRSYGLLVW